jgi:hypothetical protein
MFIFFAIAAAADVGVNSPLNTGKVNTAKLDMLVSDDAGALM